MIFRSGGGASSPTKEPSRRRLARVLTGLNKTSPVRRRFLCPLLGWLWLWLLPGRATFRNLRRHSVEHEKTFSRWCANLLWTEVGA